MRRLAWLLTFTYTADLESPSLTEARAWARGAVDFLDETPTGARALHRRNLLRAGTAPASDPVQPLREMQSRLREHLTTLAEEGVALTDARFPRVVWENGAFFARASSNHVPWIDTAFASILIRAGHTLRRCAAPHCFRLFVRRGRRDHCSATCGNRVRFARYQERHGKPTLRARQRAARRARTAAMSAAHLGDALPPPPPSPRPRTRRFASRPRT
jgi:hypothetical protein